VRSAKVTTLKRGTTVQVAGKVKGRNWYLVERGDKPLGYVYGELLMEPEAAKLALGPQLPISLERRSWLERMNQKRSRTALTSTSGGVEPVHESGGGHSVFAKAFLVALEENDGVLDGQALFDRVKRPVVINSDQTPAYSDIRYAGHDGGEFMFVPLVLAVSEFGRYHALVIGNNDYHQLPKLTTAVGDAEAVATLLEEKYGFRVTKLINATRRDITGAFNQLRATLTEKDNLLVYYAGHGALDAGSKTGYWLPVDAEPDDDSNWFSNTRLTNYVGAIVARHVLVVSDSIYVGNVVR
jgi:hypothetical protein